MLPSDAVERKKIPVYSGFLVYFPHAVAEVARLSLRGNEQHNPGSPMRWDRSKSGDEVDSLARHLLGMACSENIEDAIEEATAVAWRAMANLEKLCEKRALVSYGDPIKSQRTIDAMRGMAAPL